jgi:NAD(P)-dependent dehydrogenase (short-subunit alcohol dehydrogenase family)
VFSAHRCRPRDRLAFARQGAHVTITGRDGQRGEAAVKEIQGAGGTASFLPCDLADHEDVLGLAGQAGAVDVLVNNAGTWTLGPTAIARAVSRVVTEAPCQLAQSSCQIGCYPRR